MRPLRIRAEGFSSYREAVELDLTGVEFFSLSGPTGSGKSSLIDSMIFALYGRIPRLGGRAVAPVLAAGADRARVLFEFEVDGVAHTVVRLAQRTSSGGAAVKEARLENDSGVIADGADDVTKAVEGLLRLRFEDFTRTVVLPQGDFARFLTAARAEKQELLRSILGLDVYRTVRELAKTRAAVARDRVGGAMSRRDSLEVTDEESRKTAVSGLQSLEVLAPAVGDLEQTLAADEAGQSAAAADAERLVDSLKRLDSIRSPERFEELEQLAVAARGAVTDAETTLQTAGDRVSELESQVTSLPSAEEIAQQKKTQARLDELATELAGADLMGAVESKERATSALKVAQKTLEEIDEGLGQIRLSHAAHALSSGLAVGEPCPVCASIVSSIPERVAPADMAAMEARYAAAVDAVADARALEADSLTELTRIEARQTEQKAELDRLASDLEGGVGAGRLAEVEVELADLTRQLVEARKNRDEQASFLKKAQTELEELAEAVRGLARALTEAQLKVADLEPPVPESDDVMVQWKELVAWQHDKAVTLQAAIKSAKEGVTEAEARTQATRGKLVDSLEAASVPAVVPYSAQVAAELQAARQLVDQQRAAHDQMVKLTREIEDLEREAEVAGALANHLKANGFEQWLMVGALSRLVDGANDLMAELSEGGYSLYSDDKGSFSIVDHHNADEMRPVSTLSGGETFLVSQALALSLAETLSAAGGAGLDAIILDEGFGTLDEESLDTVATVLEELAGRGLMVGVITHVKELAARAPVRFEVSKGPNGSTVELVS